MKLTDCAELINIKKDIMKKLLLLALLLTASFPIYAAEFGEMATLGIALGAGLSIGLAALGGGIGQGIAMMGAL